MYKLSLLDEGYHSARIIAICSAISIDWNEHADMKACCRVKWLRLLDHLMIHLHQACVRVFSHSRDIGSAPCCSLWSHTTFFSSHCCQSSLEKPLEMLPSTIPCSEVSVSSLLHERTFSPYIEQNSRRHMNTGQAIGFGQQLDVVRDLISAVQTSI
jgi:hypothetical protein